MPGLFIRTTVIAGFPGETEKDVEDTLGLLKAMGVHRVGVFSYSREEGTSAYGLPDPVPREAARERTELIRRFGLALAKESSESLVGMDIPVLLAKPSVRPGYWIGRGPHQAPEVDGRTYVKIADVAPGIPSESFVTATIKRAGVLSLFASRR